MLKNQRPSAPIGHAPEGMAEGIHQGACHATPCAGPVRRGAGNVTTAAHPPGRHAPMNPLKQFLRGPHLGAPHMSSSLIYAAIPQAAKRPPCCCMATAQAGMEPHRGSWILAAQRAACADTTAPQRAQRASSGAPQPSQAQRSWYGPQYPPPQLCCCCWGCCAQGGARRRCRKWLNASQLSNMRSPMRRKVSCSSLHAHPLYKCPVIVH